MKLLISGVILLFLTEAIFGLGGKSELIPVTVKKPVVIDMEYQKYAYYKDGELSGYFYNIFRVSPDGKILTEYVGGYDLHGKNTNKVKSLKDFYTYYIFDLDKGTILNVSENWSNEIFKNNEKGLIETDIEFDYTNQTAVCVMKNWDGYKVSIQKSRIHLKKGYSFFYANNTLLLSPRLIDGTKPGIFYTVGPQMVKEAIPASFKPLGKEILNTDAGSFSTIKVGGVISDPFLAKLLNGTIKEMAMWVEDSPRALIVKFMNPDKSYGQLVETGIWKDIP